MAPMRGVLLMLTAAVAGCGGGDGPGTPPWSPELPGAAEAMGERRGLRAARGIIHLHSPYSHDACDGEPRDEVTGAVDEECLQHLRDALCAVRVDFAGLTDHDASMADEEFATLLLQRGTDELITDGDGAPIASRMTCPGGHTVQFTVGGENDLMPVAVDHHPDGVTGQALHDYYNADTPEAIAAFRANGGLAWQPHSESRTLEHIRELAPDGMEIYQLHANIDPDIRRDWLGLDPAGAIQAVAEFADTGDLELEPDLALISFVEPNSNSIAKWNTLLGEGMRISGSAGTDAHENALPITLRDGERGDSYRRMLRWFANVALVADPSDPLQVEEAYRTGRFFVAFELFGTPAGFDLQATGAGDAVEMGGEVAATAGATLELTLPAVYQLDPGLPPPQVRGRILRADADGVTEVASGPGPTLSAPLDAAGAYRAEVFITPHHLGPYLGHLGTADADREHVWIYSNPVYVTP
jgi:hypothetical protein